MCGSLVHVFIAPSGLCYYPVLSKIICCRHSPWLSPREHSQFPNKTPKSKAVCAGLVHPVVSPITNTNSVSVGILGTPRRIREVLSHNGPGDTVVVVRATRTVVLA